MMRFKRKIEGQKGFSLAETLLAVLILLLVSSIVATGIPAAKNAYEKVILGSNAQLLLSTTVSALRDELGTAWDIQVSGTTVTYFSADTGTKSAIGVDGKRIVKQEFAREVAGDEANKDFLFGEKINDADSRYGSTGVSLISEKATTDDLYIKYDAVAYADDIVTFTGLKVYRKSNDHLIADMGDANSTLTIRVIAA